MSDETDWNAVWNDAIGRTGYAPGAFPVAEDWARRCLSLPIYAEMPPDTVARAAEVLARVVPSSQGA